MISGSSLENDDDRGRFSGERSVFRTLTSREDGIGYQKTSKEYYECLAGQRENPGTCFAENLKLLRERNNKYDRLITAQLLNDSASITHCFIVNGRNIIDHSNYRQKNYCMDRYRSGNVIVSWMECDNSHDIEDEEIVKAAWITLSKEPDFNRGVNVNGFVFRHGSGESFKYSIGDWDDAARKVL